LKYAILISTDGPDCWGARSPDIDCIFSAGATREEAVEGFREALEIYLKDMKEMGKEPPEPTTDFEFIEVMDVA